MIAEACRDFRRSLLVGQTEPEHVSTCEACRRFRDRERHSAALIRDVYAEHQTPPALRDRIAAAIETARAHPGPRSRRVDRRALAAAATLAVAVGVAIVVIESGGAERGSAVPSGMDIHERGAVVASGPRHLELAGAAADLDPGATVRWRRDGGTLVVEQAGAARWMVGDGVQLRIETAAIPAAVTATGASLRVEVPMNGLDARVFGASALTAAAVAFVTVVVYEGHVAGTSGGQTVNVEPGTTIELHADKPPSLPQTVGTAPSPGDPQAKLHTHDLEAKVRELEADNQRLRERVAAAARNPAMPPTLSVPTPKVSPTLTVSPSDAPRCDEVSCVLTNYQGACCAKFKSPATHDPALAPGLNGEMISQGVAPAKAQALECRQRSSATGIVKLNVVVGPAGDVTDVRVDQAPNPELGACIAGAVKRASFAKTQHGGSFSVVF